MTADITIETIPVGELAPDPRNPRRISEPELEALNRSIQEFGLVDPVIARREDKTVIGGYQRLVAGRKLGLETVPVISHIAGPARPRGRRPSEQRARASLLAGGSIP